MMHLTGLLRLSLALLLSPYSQSRTQMRDIAGWDGNQGMAWNDHKVYSVIFVPGYERAPSLLGMLNHRGSLRVSRRLVRSIWAHNDEANPNRKDEFLSVSADATRPDEVQVRFACDEYKRAKVRIELTAAHRTVLSRDVTVPSR